ncbi:YceH family protein [Desulforhopalus singaporensis]|uniref:YceH family protein n=1 Tax=Desulforhopalus singaporensis TaxID=91360 RepID=UPI0038B320DC
MEYELTPEQARVLGCLMEKEMATPEYYPLTLNALVNACNQKSNRNPVVSFDESTVLAAIDGLKKYQLAWQSNVARVPKFEQHFDKSLNLVQREMSIICLLLLRGPQTVGELRGRSERMYSFASLEEVNDTLLELQERDLVKQIARRPGQKEARFNHLLSGELEDQDEPSGYEPVGTASPKTTIIDERIKSLEEETRLLREELTELKQMFVDFKDQFE